MTAKELRAEIRRHKAEMKECGIKRVSCFNGGLDPITYRANARLYQLQVMLDQAIKTEAKLER